MDGASLRVQVQRQRPGQSPLEGPDPQQEDLAPRPADPLLPAAEPEAIQATALL